MKRQKSIRFSDLPWSAWLPALLPLAISFFLGTVTGCLWAGWAAEAESGTLTAYIEGYLSAARSGALTVPSVFSLLWETFRWPLLTWILAFTAFGVIGIPVLFALRGFFLAFAAASFIRVLGGAGAVLSVLLFGVTGLLTLPVLFVLGTQGFTACCTLGARLLGDKHRGGIPYERTYFLRSGICFFVLLLSVCMEQAILPVLLTAAVGRF